MSFTPIVTVSKHVIAKDTLTGAGEGIGIEESADLGIVITGLEVIQTGLCSGTLAMREKSGSFQGLIILSKTVLCDDWLSSAIRVQNIISEVHDITAYALLSKIIPKPRCIIRALIFANNMLLHQMIQLGNHLQTMELW